MAGPEIVLYHYSHSPYARRIVWYLALRGIPYKECMQPVMLPRPDVARLGISYRRIPIMSIGRDVYLDTRLQLIKLEKMFPSKPKLGALTPEQKGVERLLSHFVNDAGVFGQALMLLPTDLPVLKDPRFYADRGDYLGAAISEEGMQRARPEATVEMAGFFEFLETTLLADGRDWILKTEGPSVADIEAVFPFHWLSGIRGALSADKFSAEIFPRTYAWIKRFQEAVAAGKRKNETPTVLSGEEAALLIEGSDYHEAEEGGIIDASDPVVVAQGTQRGDTIFVWPTDTGKAHRDVGKLVSIGGKEVCLEVVTEKGKTLRVHAPRHGYRIEKQAGPSRL